jgi:glutamine synthetase
MAHVILEYVWLDGYETPHMRSKIKVAHDWDGTLPIWNFDGSSTNQAPGDNSECLLSPVRSYAWEANHFLVLCEVMNPDGTPHVSNARTHLSSLNDDLAQEGFWWGFEQEYFITEDRQPLGFPKGGYPDPQGLYYCGVGGNQVRGRALVDQHLKKCLEVGITLTGTNAEVAVGQWEFQCFSNDTLKACDDLWISRYILYKLSESHGYDIDIRPKPVPGDWNGSGCHTNFSTKHMRDNEDKNYIMNILDTMQDRHELHIDGYGEDNKARLTGEHETQHISTFSWGVADRGASIRVPSSTASDGWKGYLEDRRPASNCDPYKVAKLLVDSVLIANDTSE